MDNESLESQINRLGDFILREFPEWPGKDNKNEGAMDCAIGIMENCKENHKHLKDTST